jgi:hypothetical protein
MALPAAAAWPEADRIFHADPRWRGADNAYSVPLGRDRTLWLFADSFVADPPAPRRQARPVWGNTVAVMTGRNPATAAIRFHWRESVDGPVAFFPPPPPDGPGRFVLWPGHGVRLAGGLLLFFQLVEFRFSGDDHGAPESFAFTGWAARFVDNPDDDPPQWTICEIAAPANPYGVVVGSAQVLAHDGFLYAYSANPTEPINAYLVRWPLDRAGVGDLCAPQWWCGRPSGWLDQSAMDHPPAVVLSDAKTEFTVHADPVSGGFVQVQGGEYFAARMLWRRSDSLTGPWSAPQAVYDPPELDRDNVAMYAFKVHPQLAGAELVATYVTLPADHDVLLDDERLYRPRFVRLTRQ